MKKFLKKVLPVKLQSVLKKIIYYTIYYGWIENINFLLKNNSENSEKKVSIIIPSHTSVKYARESIMSAINQTYKNIEILVMTDMPELGLEKELYGLLDKIKFYNEPTIKAPYKFNELIKKTTGDFIIFLCDDDILNNKFIEKTMYFLNNKKVDIVYTDIKLIGSADSYDIAKKWEQKNFLETTPVTITALCKREVYINTGGFDTKLYSYGDWDLWWTAFEMGFKAYHLKQPLFYYRIHPGQDTNTIDTTRAKNEVLTKHLVKK